MTLIRIMLVILSFPIYGFQMKPLQTKPTTNFIIHYEKNIPQQGIKIISEMLETKYSHYRQKFGATTNEKIEVFILNTVGRFRYESQSEIFDDGDFRMGNIYIVYQNPSEQKEKLNYILSRVVSRAVLFYLSACPPWLGEAYSLYAGNSTDRFGEPIRTNLSSFSDLSEDYSRTSEKRILKELYARLAATIKFLIHRYGESKVESMMKNFKTGISLEQNFEASFNEKITSIEKAWIRSLQTHQYEE